MTKRQIALSAIVPYFFCFCFCGIGYKYGINCWSIIIPGEYSDLLYPGTITALPLLLFPFIYVLLARSQKAPVPDKIQRHGGLS
jgi:hypothetical protein